MSVQYEFFAEALLEGTWHNIDYQTLGADGNLHHQFLAVISRSYLGRLSDLVDNAAPIPFEDLAESTRRLLLRDAGPEREQYVPKRNYRFLCDLPVLESLANAPFAYEYYLTRNQIALLERGEADNIDEYLSAKELLSLPEDARREYALYRWDEPLGSRRVMQRMVETLHDQLSCYNRSIAGFHRLDGKATDVRILYCCS